MSRFDKAAMPALLAPGLSTAAGQMITDLSSTRMVCAPSKLHNFLRKQVEFYYEQVQLKAARNPRE